MGARSASCVAFALLAAAGCGSSTARRTGGPLKAGPPADVAVSGKLGARFTFGHLFLSNPSTAPIVFESIRLRNQSPGVRILGVRVVGLDRPATVGESEEYPDHRLEGFTHPLAGYRLLAPRKGRDYGTQIVVGALASRAGHLVIFDGLEILYRQGTHRYSRFVDSRFALCIVKKPPYPRDCA